MQPAARRPRIHPPPLDGRARVEPGSTLGAEAERPRTAREAGTALIGTAAGVAVFLLLLLFAVQLLVNLYAASTVSAAGLDAARAVASRTVDHTDPGAVAAAQDRAERRLRRLLGHVGAGARVRWHADADAVRLHLVVDTPGILPSAMAGTVAFGRIDRTFVVRVEDMR